MGEFMSCELPIILASHGSFAVGALSCVELLIGTQENIATLSVESDSNIDELRQTLFEQYQNIKNEKGVLILTDIVGGTPCNLAMELALKNNNIIVYTGFNIPVLLEVFSNRHLSLDEIVQVIDDVFPQSFVNATKRISNDQADITEL